VTSGRWKELLEEIREELGEGRIRGVAWRRRLEFSSIAGNWELRVGGEEDEPGCICLEFAGKKRFPDKLIVSPRLPGGSSGTLRTGDARFDAAGSVSATRKWEGRISAGIQGSILRLWELHPSTYLVAFGNTITVTLPGLVHDRDAVLSFLFQSSSVVGEFLHAG
jgi:hypothetical protein